MQQCIMQITTQDRCPACMCSASLSHRTSLCISMPSESQQAAQCGRENGAQLHGAPAALPEDKLLLVCLLSY